LSRRSKWVENFASFALALDFEFQYQGVDMPFSAWVTLAIAIVVLFGGLAWSITITLRKNNEK